MSLNIGSFMRGTLSLALAGSLAVVPAGTIFCANAQPALAADQQCKAEVSDDFTATVSDSNVALGQSFTAKLTVALEDASSFNVRVMAFDGTSGTRYLPVSTNGEATQESDTTVTVGKGGQDISICAALDTAGVNRPFVVELYSVDDAQNRLACAYLNMNVLAASFTLNFDSCIASDDPDQLTSASQEELSKSINVVYGREYAYDPAKPQDARTLPTPQRSNYSFEGWYASYDKTTGEYSDKVTASTVVSVKANSKLYAKWVGKEYTVKLDLGGKGTAVNKQGVSVSSVKVTYGSTYSALNDITVHSNTSDQEFYNWTAVSSAGGTVPVTAESTVNSATSWGPDGTQTLTAQWGVVRESIDNAKIEGLESSYGYTGDEVEPKVTVKYTRADGAVVLLKEDRDYTLSYKNNVELTGDDGEPAQITVTGAGSYKGSISGQFSIVKGSPYFEQGSECSVRYGRTAANKLRTDAAVTYTSSDESVAKVVDAKTGEIAVFRSGTAVITAVAAGTDHFDATPKGGLSYTLKVRGASLSQCSIKLDTSTFEYDGKSHKPKITIKDPSDSKLVEDTDYVTGFSSDSSGKCKNVGKYYVVVIGVGADYSGTATKTFTITSKAPSKLKKNKVTTMTLNGKKTVFYKFKWGKVSTADGYQLKRVNGKKTKTSTFAKKSKTSQVVGFVKGSKIKAYVRSYKKDANGTKWYSAWKKVSFKA